MEELLGNLNGVVKFVAYLDKGSSRLEFEHRGAE